MTSPKKSVDIGLFLFLGLALAAALVAILEALDTRVRRPEEAGAILEVPFLGSLMAPPKGFERRILSLVRPRDPGTEGFRALHASLEARIASRDSKVVMITSSVESEGKSLTAANVAVVAARAGRNVVLLDLDLRRPGQDVLFPSSEHDPRHR